MMSESYQRVQREAEDLDAKIGGLLAFIYYSPAFEKLDEEQRYLLRTQLRAMKAYYAILEERLNNSSFT